MAIPSSYHLDGAGSAATADPVVVSAADGGGPLALPAASFIADGRFVRDGADLLIHDAAGGAVVVRGYYAADILPDLTSPDGSQILTPGLVDSFLTPAAPGQYAQAAPIAGAPPIGQVIDLDGSAFAIRADGTRVQLAKGDAVHEGDIVETSGAGSAIRMVFTDKTEFSLGADARLSLDQLVFNPDTQSGEAQFSILKGVFIFASGQIAKTDNTNMTVITPVATIGIRGTEVAGRVSASDSQFTVIDGAIEVTTQAGSVTLDDRGETTRVAGNDTPPGEPVVLAPAEFGKAYGEIAGVASTYFDQSQPGMQGPAPGGEPPAGPGGAEPDAAPAEPGGDRGDAGAAPGATALASLLSPEIAGLAPLAATLADDTTVAAVTTAPFAAAAAVVAGIQGGDPLAVVAVPGLDLASNLTFSSPAVSSAGSPGFELFPSVENIAALAGEAAGATGFVQVAYPAGPGATPDPAAAPLVSVDLAGESPPLDQVSTSGPGSPFRGESGSAEANPYITTPFGYSGPQLGDPVFDVVAIGASPANGASGAGGVIRSVAESLPPVLPPMLPPVQTEQDGAGSPAPGPQPEPEPDPEPAEISLIVSNATDNERDQDLTFNLVLPNVGPGIFDFDEIDLPGVAASASISLQRDGNGNVDVGVTSAWNSIKNIRAESETAADIAIDNFVHADVDFGDGGDSSVTISGAKRGFITTGDGNDHVEIEAYSDGAGWSHLFEVRTGEGDDTLDFAGATNGLSRLTFDGGAGTDTLRLSGPGESFSLMPGRVQIAGVERIDISGTGNTTLTLSSGLFDSPDALNDLLIVDGDAEDVLELQGSGWEPAGSTEIDGQSYALYEDSSGMRVAADVEVHMT